MDKVATQPVAISPIPTRNILKRDRQDANSSCDRDYKRVKITDDAFTNSVALDFPQFDVLCIFDHWEVVCRNLHVEEWPHLERTCKSMYLVCKNVWISFFAKHNLQRARIFQQQHQIQDRPVVLHESSGRDTFRFVFLDGSRGDGEKKKKKEQKTSRQDGDETIMKPMKEWRYIPEFIIDLKSKNFPSDFAHPTVVSNLIIRNSPTALDNYCLEYDVLLPNCFYLQVTFDPSRIVSTLPSPLLIHLLRYSPKIVIERGLIFVCDNKEIYEAKAALIQNLGLKSLRYSTPGVHHSYCIVQESLYYLRTTQLKRLELERRELPECEIFLNRETCSSLRYLHIGSGFHLSSNTWKQLSSEGSALRSIRLCVSEYQYFFECLVPHLLFIFASKWAPEECILENGTNLSHIGIYSYRHTINRFYIQKKESELARRAESKNDRSIWDQLPIYANECSAFKGDGAILSSHPPLRLKKLNIQLCLHPFLTFYAMDTLFLRSFEFIQELTLECRHLGKEDKEEEEKNLDRVLASLSAYHAAGRELRHLRLNLSSFSPDKLQKVAAVMARRISESPAPFCHVHLSFASLAFHFRTMEVPLHLPSDLRVTPSAISDETEFHYKDTLHQALKSAAENVVGMKTLLVAWAREFERLSISPSTKRGIELELEIKCNLSYGYRSLCPWCFCNKKVHALKLRYGESASVQSGFSSLHQQRGDSDDLFLEHWIKSEIYYYSVNAARIQKCPCRKCKASKNKPSANGVEGGVGEKEQKREQKNYDRMQKKNRNDASIRKYNETLKALDTVTRIDEEYDKDDDSGRKKSKKRKLSDAHAETDSGGGGKNVTTMIKLRKPLLPHERKKMIRALDGACAMRNEAHADIAQEKSRILITHDFIFSYESNDNDTNVCKGSK